MSAGRRVTNWRSIPATMPIAEAANLMVRRGQCDNWHRAKAIIENERRAAYARKQSEEERQRSYRPPYADGD